MPSDIVIVRHALCTGNTADRASRKGNHSLFTPKLRAQKSAEWPLTPQGIVEAQLAGQKIREMIASVFDHYFRSDILRVIETSRHLGFGEVCWEIDTRLREREWGGVENLPYPERNEAFKAHGISPTEDSMEWHPPGGESMIVVVRKMSDFLTMLERRVVGKKILVITHGAPVHAMRVIQHKVGETEYAAFVGGNNYIRNCQIFHYFEKRIGNSTVPRYLFERSAFMAPDGTWVENLRKLE